MFIESLLFLLAVIDKTIIYLNIKRLKINQNVDCIDIVIKIQNVEVIQKYLSGMCFLLTLILVSMSDSS